jgi:hypothetical protein
MTPELMEAMVSAMLVPYNGKGNVLSAMAAVGAIPTHASTATPLPRLLRR